MNKNHLGLKLNSQEVKSANSKEVPMVLLGNKGDMVHLRQVSSEEGCIHEINI